MTARGPDRYSYQDTGARWLHTRSRAGLLGDEQGIGKTVQAIDAADYALADTILVLCKSIAKLNWQREFTKWSTADRPVAIPSTTDRIPDEGVVILNYDIAHYPAVLRQLVKRRWDVLIADEMQVLKAGAESKRGQAVLDPRRGLHTTAEQTWGLSGTPLPNHAGEIYPWLRAMHPKALKKLVGSLDYWDFMDRFVEYTVGQFGVRVFRNLPRAREELSPLLLDTVMLRRKRKDVLPELPNLTTDVMVVPGDAAYASVLAELSEHPEIMELETAVRAANDPDDVYAVMSSEETHMATLRRYIGLAKADSVADLAAAELDQGEPKIVIMAWHQEVMERIVHRLQPYGVAEVSRRVSKNVRQDGIDLFQSDQTTCRVLVGQILTAGTSITLTAAARLLFAEVSWSADDNEQAMLRILRIGQNRHCRIGFTALQGSIDEAVMRVYERKAAMTAELIG